MNKIKNVVYGATAAVAALAPSVAGAQWGIGKGNAYSSGTPAGTITNIVMQTMNWLLALVGFLGIIGFVIAGILYLTAAGDDDQISKAKSAMMYSIIGVIVALLGYVIIQAVDAWLGGSTATF